jgi:7-carboxy-7-deazaguanine synthase
MLKINEIFFSIQGESSTMGWPTVFIRTSGCNLRCTYCDTTYAYYEGKKMSLDDIVTQTQSYGAKYVCVTGGEPLLQKGSFDLMRRLCDVGFQVSCETSGSVSCKELDSRVKKILDVKTPDSGEANSFLIDNLSYADQKDEFKFVICSEKDFQWSEEFVSQHNLTSKYQVLYSPSFGNIDAAWLAERILTSHSKARLQLQLHKYIWSPLSRGV